MAVGWSRDGSVQEQIDATVESEVQLAKSRLPHGDMFLCLVGSVVALILLTKLHNRYLSGVH